MIEYVFVIYSCKKYLKKANLLYSLIYNRLNNCKCYVIYGDPNLENDYKITFDKYISLKCGDYYEHLTEKTITLFKVIQQIHPDVKGVFKCDDDIIPNIHKLNDLFQYLNNNTNIDYLGHTVKYEYDESSYWHYNKCSDIKFNVLYPIKKCHHTSGPLYFLSMNAIRIFNNINKNEFLFYEDTMVGYYLNQQNIFPVHYHVYNDNFCYEDSCMQNVDSKCNHLFIELTGGLGNQLFQVASAYGISKKNNMNLILLYNNDYKKHMTHNTDRDEFMNTIFNYFNYTLIENVNVSNENVNVHSENKCFDYDSFIIKENSKNYLLKGYFQNQQYFEEYKSELIHTFKNDNISNQLLNKYSLLEKSYFIHLRRGDYVGHWLYEFNRDDYFTKATEYILNKDKNSHFYILSDDIDFCKGYSILNNINKTFIEDMSTLETLYFMSLCKKGGICSNSTFSGWATNLNTNKDKIVIVPKQWINVNYPYKIPFDFTETF